MKPWTWTWFQKFIDFCRKWKWFDTYIYGKSFNLEDFVRNPAEVLRDNCFPFVIKNIKAYSIINWRIGYLPYDPKDPVPNCWSIPMGNRKYLIEAGDWVISDLRLFNPWCTKFCNCLFFFQLALSFKYYVIPIPFVSLNIRFNSYSYFQFDCGWGPENSGNTVMCGKFRYVNQKTSDENVLNPTDIMGFYEGSI